MTEPKLHETGQAAAAELLLPAAPVHRALEGMRRRCDTWTSVGLGIGVTGELLARVLRAGYLTHKSAALWAERLEIPPVLLWSEWRPTSEDDETEED